ncbi:hypothetical protein LNTAR_05361 [Lentisphaera araneosa HTCC2155]|uniref:Uncharacterized protein n=2 Tax=Lentisphaera TaxID=256846 RepID=A6DLQ9_9BACT|nr:hypothetical protein LNTAR_05361 [Lentisphaera araneosa HTCC2155]
MGFWTNFSHFLTLRPMPLGQEWVDFTMNKFKVHDKSPVKLNDFTLFPEPMLMRKYIAPEFLEDKIHEIEDLLIYMCSRDYRDSCGFMHLADEEELKCYGSLTISMIGGKTGKKPGLFIKTQDHMDEAFEYNLRAALKPMLAPFKLKPEIGFTLNFQINPVHPKWKVPAKYKKLEF